MKVSLNWVKQFTDVDLGLEPLIEKIGAQLGAVDEVVNLGERYQGIVVVRVVTCEPHPDANKLSVCMIDDGGVVKSVPRDTHGLVQVVCGAPDVTAGILAAWIPPGVTVPSTYNSEPMVLETRKIRGALSNGMLASPKELAFGDNHEGLLSIDEDAQPGSAFAEVYKLNDHIIDIENKMFTHRPDLFGIIGIAREIAGITGRAFKSPDWYLNSSDLGADSSSELALEIKNELPKLVPRFCAVTIAGVTVAPSPMWLQSYLMRVGIRPINNIVDLTNFVMYETGQPLHAYDYDKLAGRKIVIRYPKPNEELKLLGGKTIVLEKGTIVIADDQNAVGLGGVMGGQATEVDEQTTNVVLESANFNMNEVRQAAMAYGLFSDAAIRFSKNQSPTQNLPALTKLADDVRRITGGKIAGSLQDINNLEHHGPTKVKTTVDFINSRLGEKLSATEIKRLLGNVEVEVDSAGSSITLKPPFWRTDLQIPEDIVEEVGRLHGYEYLPLILPVRDLTPVPENRAISFKLAVREILSRAGASEILTYSFVRGSLLEQAGQDPKLAYHIRNALSPDLQYYRLSITPSLLSKIYPNIKQGFESFALFELGKTHSKTHSKDGDEPVPKEFETLSLVVATKEKTLFASQGSAYFTARRFLDFLAGQLGIRLEYRPMSKGTNDPMAGPYEPERSAQILIAETNTPVGVAGEFKQSVAADLKLPRFTAGFEIGLDTLIWAPPKTSGYQPVPRFPYVEQDISLKAPSAVTYGQLYEFLSDKLGALKPDQSLASLQPSYIYRKDMSAKYKNFSFRLNISSFERTLTSEEVNRLLDDLAEAAKGRFKVVRI